LTSKKSRIKVPFTAFNSTPDSHRNGILMLMIKAIHRNIQKPVQV